MPERFPGRVIALAMALGRAENCFLSAALPVFDSIDVTPSFINWRFTFRVGYARTR
jgi:hypothetical protein